MSVWDKTTPTGSDNVSAGDDRIRELKEALEDALSSHGTFPGAAPSTAPIYVPLGIVATTKMLFYQASAPTGWTVDDTVDGYVFAGVTQASTNGGSVAAASALGSESTHTHAGGTLKVPAFRWDYSNDNAVRMKDSSGNWDVIGSLIVNRTLSSGGSYEVMHGANVNTEYYVGVSGWTGATGAGASHTHTHTTAMHAQARTICCTKD